MPRSGRTAAIQFAIVCTIVCGSAGAFAKLAWRLPDRWPDADQAILDSNNESMYLRATGDTAELLAHNAELVQQGVDQPWTIYSLARNAYVALGRAPVLKAIEKHDLGALTDGQAIKGDISDDGWQLMRATIAWQSNRYASAEEIINQLAARHPQWDPVLAHMLWFCLDARMASIPELQACLDRQAHDGISLTYAVSRLVKESDESPDDLAELREFIKRGNGGPELDLLADMTDLELQWLDQAPTAWEMGGQWRDLLQRHGNLAYDQAAFFAYEISSLLPMIQCRPLLAELGRPRLGKDFRLQLALNRLYDNRELAAKPEIDRSSPTSRAALNLKYSLTNMLACGDSLSSILATIREYAIATGHSRYQQESYHLLGQEDEWAEVWDELNQEFPKRTITHRLGRLSTENLPELLALRDSLSALDINLSGFEAQFEDLDAATATEVDVAAISAEPDPRRRTRLFERAHITAEMRGDHELRDELIRAEVSVTNDPWVVRKRARTPVLDGDREMAELALQRLDELGDDFNDGLELRVLAARALDGPTAARELLKSINVDTINSISLLSTYSALAQVLELPDLQAAASRRLTALAPESYTAKMQAVIAARSEDDNETAVAILRDLAAQYPGSQNINQKLLELGDSVTTLASAPTEAVDRKNLFRPFGDDLTDVAAVRAREVTGADTLQSDVIILLSQRNVVLTGLDDAWERNRRITQVLTRAGADVMRSFSFAFDPGNGIPHVRVARVITPEGKVLDTDPKTILMRAPEDQDSDVSDTREMFIPLQGVEPGAIIDIVYDLQNGAYLDNTWSMTEFFLAGAPVRDYEFALLAPPDHPVYAVTHGDIEAAPRDSVTGIRRWSIHDLQPAIDQDKRPSLTEVIPWVGLTTFPDWDAAGRNYGPRFWQTVTTSPRLTALADSLTRDVGGKREKAEALYRYVVEEITPLAIELGAGRLVPSTCDEVLDRGWGDCKDDSHLLVALLQAAGIEARPVLVSTLGNMRPREDLPSLSFFNHMIVQITGIKGEPYCDPINGASCIEPLPAISAGRPGLHLNRDGSSVLQQVTPNAATDNVSELEVDVRPVGERSLSFEITGRFSGSIGDYMKRITAFGDTSVIRSLLDQTVGYGVPNGVPIRTWSVSEEDCGRVEIAMTYLDTTWAEEGASTASLQHRNEASMYWELPPSKDRLYDVIFPANYTARLVLRLHGNDVWIPAERIVPFNVENDFCHGTIKGRKSKEDGKRLLTITHEFAMTRNVVPLDSYRDFRRDAIAYAMFSLQRYDFRRVLDKDMLKGIMKYAKDNPSDEGFRLNAAANLLGTDMGGYGEEGEPRRKAAMKLLAPLVERDDPNSLAALLVSRIHMKRNQYQVANEVATRALAHAPDDLYLLSSALVTDMELGRWERAAANLATLANKLGSAEIVKQYAMALLALGDEEGAQAQFERMRLLGSPISEHDEAFLRFMVAEQADDLAGLKTQLARLEALPEADDNELDTVRCAIYSLEHQTEKTIPLLEDQLADNPGSSFLCNNLAWSYVICGRNLERALMLSRAASLLQDDPSSSLNTYAAVLGRMGDWKAARKIFRDLYENDDRPDQRKVNGYFLGLAEFQLGHPDKAREVWQTIVDQPSRPKWDQRVVDSLKALDEGGDVAALVFEG